jgi:hypothetical protein
MLNSLFNRVKSFLGCKTHFNPTDLPDFVIDQFCEFVENGDVNTYDLISYHTYLWKDCLLCPPPLEQVMNAAEEGRLRDFLKESVDLNFKYVISLKLDHNAIRKGVCRDGNTPHYY